MTGTQISHGARQTLTLFIVILVLRLGARIFVGRQTLWRWPTGRHSLIRAVNRLDMMSILMTAIHPKNPRKLAIRAPIPPPPTAGDESSLFELN